VQSLLVPTPSESFRQDYATSEEVVSNSEEAEVKKTGMSVPKRNLGS